MDWGADGMIRNARICEVNFFKGSKYLLTQKTAVVLILFEGDASAWQQLASDTLRQKAHSLRPGDPLYGVRSGDWPQAFMVQAGTNPGLAEWILALTVAMQRWARDPVRQGQVLESVADANGLSVRLALPYQRQAVLVEAVRQAVHQCLLWQAAPVQVAKQTVKAQQALETWLQQAQRGGLAPNTLRFALAALQRNVPLTVHAGMLRLGWGCRTELMDSSFTGTTSNIASRMARNKYWTRQLLETAGIPVARGTLVATLDAAQRLAVELGWPVVVKPSNQDQGTAVVPGIKDDAELQKAFEAAAVFSPGAVLLEKHVDGDDHRMLVVGGRLLMATKRIAGGVTGNGRDNIASLVQQVNADPRRGADKRSILMALTLDEEAVHCLAEQDLDAHSVPDVGRFVRLRRTANISTGGTALDVTQRVHPDNRLLAERAARAIGLDIAGVDFLCSDISRSWRAVGGAVCEVNAQPGFRPHWLGDPSRDVNGEILDWLFRLHPARIPTAAVFAGRGGGQRAGHVGRLLHHIGLAGGKLVGLQDGGSVWVAQDVISAPGQLQAASVNMLLTDPSVESAVMVMQCEDLANNGHVCDAYDVAALVQLDATDPVDRSVALEVLQRTTGVVVLKADDPSMWELCEQASRQRCVAVTQFAEATGVQEHLARVGEVAFVQNQLGNDWVVWGEGLTRTPWMLCSELHAVLHDLPGSHVEDVLCAAALAKGQGFTLAHIREALLLPVCVLAADTT
jgi:cyanophycin synthetase